MDLAYQSFQGLERCLPSEDVSESRLLQQIGRQEQCLQDLEDRIAELHNQSMKVGDRLGDLETGCCRCSDVVVDSPPVSSESHQVSPSLSAVQGEEDEGAGTVTSETAVENITPIPILVCGQRAHRTIQFWFNSQSAPSWKGGSSTLGDSTAFGPLKHQGGGRSLRQRRGRRL